MSLDIKRTNVDSFSLRIPDGKWLRLLEDVIRARGILYSTLFGNILFCMSYIPLIISFESSNASLAFLILTFLAYTVNPDLLFSLFLLHGLVARTLTSIGSTS